MTDTPRWYLSLSRRDGRILGGYDTREQADSASLGDTDIVEVVPTGTVIRENPVKRVLRLLKLGWRS